MHSCLCELYVKSLGLMPSGFNFLFRTRPHAWLQQTPPEPALIPYDVTRQQWVKMFWLHRFSGLHHPSIMLWCYMMSLGRIDLTIFCIHRFSALYRAAAHQEALPATDSRVSYVQHHRGCRQTGRGIWALQEQRSSRGIAGGRNKGMARVQIKYKKFFIDIYKSLRNNINS